MNMMSNAERVEGNDDLLTEILLSLPPKSIFRFLSVSKRWNNNIIRDPCFLNNYMTSTGHSRGRGRDLAFIQKQGDIVHSKIRERPSFKHTRPMNILPTNLTPPGNYIKFVPRKFGYFVNSSDGLILCHRPTRNQLTVLNLVTKKWVLLPPRPPLPKNKYYQSVGLMMCHQTTTLSANYIVVQTYGTHHVQTYSIHEINFGDVNVDDDKTNILEIATYSSKSGEWAESTLVGTGNFGLRDWVPMVANGVFHWLSYMSEPKLEIVLRSIAVYDPNDGQRHIQLIIHPYHWDEVVYPCIVSRCPHHDVLWYATTDEQAVRFWMLPKNNNNSYKRSTTIPVDEWVLVYDFSVEFLSKELTIPPDHDQECRLKNTESHEVCLDNIISWNPLVVLVRKRETWFLYNVETMTAELVKFDGGLISRGNYEPILYPLLQSSFLSSYAL